MLRQQRPHQMYDLRLPLWCDEQVGFTLESAVMNLRTWDEICKSRATEDQVHLGNRGVGSRYTPKRESGI